MADAVLTLAGVSVYRDGDGRHWVGGVGEEEAVELDYEPAEELNEDGTAVVGGLLPPGATRASVRDPRGEMQPARTGSGVWLALIEDHGMFSEPAVVYRDEGGSIVPRPAPEGAEREPVPDAGSECPACAGREWERLVAGGDADLRCTRCGHVEEMGLIARAEAVEGGLDTREPIEAVEDELGRSEPIVAERELYERDLAPLMKGLARETRGVFEKVRFPVYAPPPSWPGERSFGGWSSEGRRVSAVTLRHQALSVETSRPGEDDWETERERCLRALTEVLLRDDAEAGAPGGSDAAVALGFAAREREHSEAAFRAEEGRAEIRVDGEPAPFYVLTSGAAWAACGRVGDVVVTASGTEGRPKDLELARVEDPEPYTSWMPPGFRPPGV